jgi:hypothetical protein
MEPQKEPTKEQMDKIKKLYMASFWRCLGWGFQSALLLTAANIVLAFLMVQFQIENPNFALFGSFINIFFIFRAQGRKIRKDHDTLREEIKKILSS